MNEKLIDDIYTIGERLRKAHRALKEELVVQEISHMEGKATREQFVVFTKPELLHNATPRQFRTILVEFFDRFRDLGVEIERVLITNSLFLKKYGLIDKCYERLNLVSRSGLRACSSSHRSIISKEIEECQIALKNVLGGDRFLERFSRCDSQLLGELIDNLGCKKFGAGIYGTHINVEGERYLVLNGFYPAQRAWLEGQNDIAIAFSLNALNSWKWLRRNLIGDIFPSNSEPTSIRGLCWANRDRYKIGRVDIARNCIHFAANPVDAALYMKHLFGIQLARTNLGYLARNQGLGISKVLKIYRDKNLTAKGKKVDLRDLIEDTTTKKTLSIIRSLLDDC